VIITMYFQAPSVEYTPTRVAPALGVALFIAAIGTLYLGILPSRVLEFAHQAAVSLLSR